MRALVEAEGMQLTLYQVAGVVGLIIVAKQMQGFRGISCGTLTALTGGAHQH